MRCTPVHIHVIPLPRRDSLFVFDSGSRYLASNQLTNVAGALTDLVGLQYLYEYFPLLMQARRKEVLDMWFEGVSFVARHVLR
jgi:hypothetical protein